MIAGIALIVLSVVVWLICQFAVGSDKLGFPAILSLFFTFFLTFGVFYIVFALVKKSSYTFASGGVSFVVGLIFLFAALKFYWWVILVLTIALLSITALATVALKAPELHIQFDNQEGSGHKTYAEKKAEEAAKEKEPEEELPKLKSFKD